MFFIVVVGLAIYGLFALLGVAAAELLLLPIIALKIAFFVLIFSLVAKVVRGHDWDGRHRHHWGPRPTRRRRRPERPARSDEDRFDEWHRLAHAREEVDSWVDDLPKAE